MLLQKMNGVGAEELKELKGLAGMGHIVDHTHRDDG